MKNYEFYLTDDAGRRITLLKNAAFMSMSRTTLGYGTLHAGFPFRDFKVYPPFLPDRRMEVWRAPQHGATMRREGSFFLRKYNVYTREEDGVDIIEFYGRSPLDILRRQHVTSTTAANYSKTNEIDDMMQEIVTENFITPAQTAPTGELSVGGTQALGPIVSHTFFAQNVLDTLKELRDMSFSLNKITNSSRRIFFDVVEGAPLANGGFAYIFRTYADLRGTDRTGGVIFSIENGNLKSPSYYEDYLDSITKASILNLTTPAANGSATSPDATLSRWNTIVSAQQSSEVTAALNNAKANALLREQEADIAFNGTFLDSPGSDKQPRSLYGVDWDLGDLLPVQYAGKNFNSEVVTVYVSVNENGEENIVGISSPRVITPAGVPPPLVEYLVVAGGGGGGEVNTAGRKSGGGGAGGLKTATGYTVVPGTSYPIVVGAGGAGAVNPGGTSVNGSNSSFDTITSTGGGGGGGNNVVGGKNGGSGGGGFDNFSALGTGIGGQGFDGSAGGTVNTNAGGGGGAGGVGGLSAGGIGVASSISGASVTYATGGRGGDVPSEGAVGGANTGDGGGGRKTTNSGFAGGSGIVIVRHLTLALPTATGGTITTDGLYTVHTFTANGTFVA